MYIDVIFYKRGFSSFLFGCIGGKEATYILWEIHEGVYNNHLGRLTLAQKVLSQGYYWLTLKNDALQFIRKCGKY